MDCYGVCQVFLPQVIWDGQFDKLWKKHWSYVELYYPHIGLQVYNIYSFKPHSSYFINFIEIVWKKICSTTFNFLVYSFTGLQLMYFINYDNYNCIIHNFGLQVYSSLIFILHSLGYITNLFDNLKSFWFTGLQVYNSHILKIH